MGVFLFHKGDPVYFIGGGVISMHCNEGCGFLCCEQGGEYLKECD